MFTFASKALGVAKAPPGPPASTDPNFANVSLLMHMDGANGGIVFLDQKNHTVVSVGSPTTSSTQVKFGPTSLALDGSTMALSVTSPDMAMGSGDFTFECWAYQTSRPSVCSVLCISQASGVSGIIMQIGATGVITLTSAGAGIGVGTLVVPLNQWTHLAVSRNSGTLRSYIGGLLDITTTNTTNFSDGLCHIGQFSGGSQRFPGYIDDVRLTPGVGRYPAAFSPPTAAFPNTSGNDPFIASVVLLTTNDTTSFTDAKGHTLTANGTVSMSNAQTKFTPYSLFTNGVGYLTAADSNDWDFGSGDFTIETWAYQTNPNAGYLGQYQGVVEQAVLGTFGNGAFDAALNNGATLGNLHIGGGNNNFAGATPMSSNVWHHLCWERAGNTVRCYIDGVVQATITVSGAINPSTHPLAIGADSAGQGMFVGYLGQTRLTKGVARYNGAFPVPTEAFPTT